MFSRYAADRLNAVRLWIALQLVGLAYRISPVGVLPLVRSAEGLPGGNATVFRVERELAGRCWTLYDGQDPAVARKTFEGVKQRRELGAMRLTMDDGHGAVVRGSYHFQPTQ